MTPQPLETDIIVKRLDGIAGEIMELKRLAGQDPDAFAFGDGWKLAQFHLHRALEGVFNIGTHILSRIPGAQVTQYREIAKKLGETGIVPQDFADSRLVEMAKYRNRLVHFYSQISPKELHGIISKDLGDFDVFMEAVKQLLADPSKFGLSAE